MLFHDSVVAEDGDVGDTVLEILGNITVAQVEYFEGEVGRSGFELPFAIVNFNATFFEQLDAVV